ncbi:MAG: peptidase M23 [Proteobacteria bacterium]|nr:MAG: peptidase M23 [Pseudomonadota bacterium]
MLAGLLIALAAAPWLETPAYAVRLLLRDPPDVLAVPVAGVSRRALRDSWGAPRSGSRAHQGIDIFAPRGTPVVASTEGIVWSTGESPRGGRVVWLLGPGRQLHYYAHLDRVADLEPGRRIRAGDVVGWVGDTGNARGGAPHLHYGVYERGGARNPYPLLVPPPQPASRDDAAPRPRG